MFGCDLTVVRLVVIYSETRSNRVIDSIISYPNVKSAEPNQNNQTYYSYTLIIYFPDRYLTCCSNIAKLRAHAPPRAALDINQNE